MFETVNHKNCHNMWTVQKSVNQKKKNKADNSKSDLA